MAEHPDPPPPTLASLRLRTKPTRITPTQPSLLFPEPPTPKLPRAPKPAPEIYTVRDLVSGIREHVERTYTDLWVSGEISNCRPAPSGHLYFTLKDGEAQLPVVLFRRAAQLLRFRPKDGDAVEVRGRVSVYESRGQLQFIAETLRLRGAGALQLAFDRLKARLLAEGLFDPARKRPLPAFPRCIGLITSPTGAVLRDILTVARRRHANLNLLVYPALMQGPNSPAQVAAGIRWFNRNRHRADLILIARGGGSAEDLAAFNDESLARAIAASHLPVVSAIGHETDFTIADFTADLRAPTPSAAAEIITAAQHLVESRLASLDARARRAIRYHLLHLRQRLSRLSAEQVLRRLHDAVCRRDQRLDDLRFRLEASSARHLRARHTRLAHLDTRLRRQDIRLRLARAQSRLTQLQARLARLAQTLIATRQTRLAHLQTRLDALSPLAVLSRGYALVYALNGSQADTLLRTAAQTQPGQQIRARLAHGSLTATITETAPQ